MLMCFCRRKLATLLIGLCIVAMIMSINKYISSDNSKEKSVRTRSKSNLYYPFDDTGQLRHQQHLPPNDNSYKFKAWQVDEENLGVKNIQRNVIETRQNDDEEVNKKDDHEVVIRNFNNQNKDYAFHDDITTDRNFVANKNGRKKDLGLHENEELDGNNNNNLGVINIPAADLQDSDTPVFSPDGQRYIPRHRVVHLDLKGAPPMMSYLKSILPLLKEAGATALLVEYEDMFPYWGRLKNISARNAYTIEEIKNLRRWAAKHGMIVIPLVQTFGHLEHALKLAEYHELREVSAYPQSLCPSRNGSWHLVKEMIDQMVELHPDVKWLHIGCDEVFQLGMCSLCTEKLMKFNSDPEKVNVDGVASGYMNDHSLFLEHVHRVASYVRNKKGMIPIIWDDMLRKIQSEKLVESGIGHLVEPMVWVYVEDIDRFIYSFTWSTYGEVFEHIWTASAYKGAFGEQLYVVNVARHVYNNQAWLDIMKRETMGPDKLNFRGIVLTGWSRYDHFAVLCELLPASIPSLILNLVICSRGGHDEEAARRANRILQCPSHKSPMSQQELMHNPEQLSASSCRFPGANILSLLSAYKSQAALMKSAYERVDEREGWMTEYNAKHKFSSPWRVREAMQSIGVGDYLLTTLETFQDNFIKALSVVYDKYTVDEWMEQHIEPLINMLNGLMHRAQILTDSQIWPRRPLNFKKLSKPKKKIASASAAKSEDRYVDVKRKYNKMDDNDNIDQSINNSEIKNNNLVDGIHGTDIKKRKRKSRKKNYKTKELLEEKETELIKEKEELLPPSQ